MTTETNSGLEEVCMTLDFLGPLCKWGLIVARVEGFQRIGEECLIRQHEKERILFQYIDLRYLASIKNTSRLGSGFFGPTIR